MFQDQQLKAPQILMNQGGGKSGQYSSPPIAVVNMDSSLNSPASNSSPRIRGQQTTN